MTQRKSFLSRMNNIASRKEAMTSKWQKYLAIAIMVLVGVLIVVKLIYNYKAKQVVWEDTDAASLTSACLNELGGYSVRFAMQSEKYCECSTQAIIENLDKAEYLLIETKSDSEQEEKLLPIILDCYNEYQEAIYNASNLD